LEAGPPNPDAKGSSEAAGDADAMADSEFDAPDAESGDVQRADVPNGTPCWIINYCGVDATAAYYQDGLCVDNSPHWMGGVPSCGEANRLCGTQAGCGLTGPVCHATWDCSTCCVPSADAQ
jgi:hypothetical protein